MALFSRQSEETSQERMRRLEMTHAERIKALEMGRPLPEVEIAQAKADEVRARAAAGWAIVRIIFTVLGPAAVLGITLGASAVILSLAAPSLHLILLSVVWICSALICLGIVVAFLLGAQQLSLPELLRKQVARNPVPPREESRINLDPTLLGPEEVDRLSQSFQK